MTMTLLPDDLYYTSNHEWLQVDENLATLGLSHYAIQKMGEILYLDLPEDGQKLSASQLAASLESILELHDLLSPINGTVLEVNAALLDSPDLVNDDPYGDGWLLRIEMDNEKDLASLMRVSAYKEYLAGLQKKK